MDWITWSRAVASAIASVPDEVLLGAAGVLRSAGVVLTAGNGGSAAIASHAAQALLKPSYAPGGGVAAVCLSDCVPALTAHANDGGWPGALVECARPFLDAGASLALLLVSSSGRSENLVRLARLGRERGLPVVALTGFSGEPLRSLATVSIHVDSDDYEVIEPAHDAVLHRAQYHLRTLSCAERPDAKQAVG